MAWSNHTAGLAAMAVTAGELRANDSKIPGPTSQRNLIRWLLAPLLVSLGYYLGAEIAFYIGTSSDEIFALFWPPNVILFFALVTAPQRRWWLYIAAVFPAHVIAETVVGMPLGQMLVAFVTNCCVALLNAYLVQTFVDREARVDTFRKTLRYIGISAVLAPAISALGGAFVPILGGGSSADYWLFWSHWYMANAVPNITLGFAFLAWRLDAIIPWPLSLSRRHIEPALLALALVAVCIITARLGSRLSNGFLASALLLPLPLVLLAAFRFGEKGASGALLTVAVILTWYTLHETGLFHGLDPAHGVLALQLFLTGLSVPVLLLAALIDELRYAEQTTRALASYVMRAQDDERRRIARELHDSTGQNLIGATLLSDRLERMIPKAGRPLLQQLDASLRQSLREIRTLSYLLHPPLLDEAGLSLALSSFVEGYVERSGIDVTLDVSKQIGRLSPTTELVLFRVVQEALTNISRHSQSATASIRLEQQRSIFTSQAILTIEDAGKGIPTSRLKNGSLDGENTGLSGVGLASMRERLAQVGGRLEIQSVPGHTRIRASVPLAPPSPT